MDNILNNSLILPEISPLSFEFGGMAGVEDRILFPDGSLLLYLPEFETQSSTYMDDYGCVSRSFGNGVESLVILDILNFNDDNQEWLKNEIYKNGKPNFSDRDLIVLSGTKPRSGNSGEKVLETAQKKGLIPQIIGDWDPSSRDTSLTEEKFYAYARTPEAQKLADEWNKRFEITGEWVSRSNLEEASKRGAIQIYVNAWYKNNDEIYYNPNGRYNHAVLLADYNKKQIFDSYYPEIKEIDSWNSIYPWALKINIKEKTMIKPKIINNSLVILVEGSGEIGLYLDDKIIIDDAAKIQSVFMARNAKNGIFSGGPVISLKLDQWNMFEKRNLKMEKL